MGEQNIPKRMLNLKEKGWWPRCRPWETDEKEKFTGIWIRLGRNKGKIIMGSQKQLEACLKSTSVSRTWWEDNDDVFKNAHNMILF